jgi:hypothetical protein
MQWPSQSLTFGTAVVFFLPFRPQVPTTRNHKPGNKKAMETIGLTPSLDLGDSEYGNPNPKPWLCLTAHGAMEVNRNVANTRNPKHGAKRRSTTAVLLQSKSRESSKKVIIYHHPPGCYDAAESSWIRQPTPVLPHVR